MTYIDMRHWPRRDTFAHFSGCVSPFYSVTYRQDVTALVDYCHARGLSFYLAMVYLVTQAANAVENFRYTIEDGRVALLDERIPSYCDLHPGSELFHIVTLPAGDSLEGFCAAAAKKSAAQEVFLDPIAESSALIYLSCLPWIDLTALTNERNDLNTDDAIPRIAWGKHVDEGGRRRLGMSVEVNHRLIDGYHVGLFAKELTERIEGLK